MFEAVNVQIKRIDMMGKDKRKQSCLISYESYELLWGVHKNSFVVHANEVHFLTRGKALALNVFSFIEENPRK